MKKINVFEAKARFSEYLDAVMRGEQVVICRRNTPVAELRAIAHVRTTPRPLGGAKGLTIPDAFFEPLPDQVIETFYGDVPALKPSRVAERPPTTRRVKSSRQSRKRSR